MEYSQNEHDEMNRFDSTLRFLPESIDSQLEFAERKFAEKFKGLLLENLKANQVENLLRYTDETNLILERGAKGDVNVTMHTDEETIFTIIKKHSGLDKEDYLEHYNTPLLLRVDIGEMHIYHVFYVQLNPFHTYGLEFNNTNCLQFDEGDKSLSVYKKDEYLYWLDNLVSLGGELAIGDCMFNELKLISALKKNYYLNLNDENRLKEAGYSISW